MKLTSTAFENNQCIPMGFTGEGENESPPLTWDDVPEEAKEFVLLCEDPDAPPTSHEDAGDFVHWMVYRIPGYVRALPQNIPHDELKVFGGMEQGTNSKGKVGYHGPLPPIGDDNHRYRFTLFALDQPLKVRPALNKERILKEMEGHVIAKAELTGLYRRKAEKEDLH